MTQTRSTVAHTCRHHLTDEQCQRLRWLQGHKCLVDADAITCEEQATEELVLTVTVDRHSIISTHGYDPQQVFERAFAAAMTFLSLGQG
ncbi:hypothetical protein [Deinococcus pimensis]|uniref:hypothetical protein n=1 Tax=Deinococcus pimensis TaxID=309888 RepID=UPI0004821B09|nr:hypothetical protein [Deinococcus pimensis]